MSIYLVTHDIIPVRGTRAFGCLGMQTECCSNSRRAIEMSVASSRYAHGVGDTISVSQTDLTRVMYTIYPFVTHT